MRKTVRILLLTTVLASVAAACGSGAETGSQGTPTASPTDFVVQEWSISAPTTQLHAGDVTVTVTNRGSETHELVIVRVDNLAGLPTKADGSVDEDLIPESAKPGEIADIKPGTTVSQTMNLAPGNYVAICNLVESMGMGTDNSMGMGSNSGMGDGQAIHIHYLLGMAVEFTVV